MFLFRPPTPGLVCSSIHTENQFADLGAFSAPRVVSQLDTDHLLYSYPSTFSYSLYNARAFLPSACGIAQPCVWWPCMRGPWMTNLCRGLRFQLLIGREGLCFPPLIGIRSIPTQNPFSRYVRPNAARRSIFSQLMAATILTFFLHRHASRIPLSPHKHHSTMYPLLPDDPYRVHNVLCCRCVRPSINYQLMSCM